MISQDNKVSFSFFYYAKILINIQLIIIINVIDCFVEKLERMLIKIFIVIFEF